MAESRSVVALSWPQQSQPRWLSLLNRILIALFVGRAVWETIQYVSTGEGLGRLIWTTVVALVFVGLEVARGAFPMEAQITDEALMTPRPYLTPRVHRWSQVRAIREKNAGRWTQGLVADLVDGTEVPVFPVEIGDAAALEKPEVLRFLEAARERISASE